MIIMTSPLIPPGPLTAADLYSEVAAVRRDVALMLTKVEVMNARFTLAAGQVDDHEARLRTVQGSVPDNLAGRLTAVEKWQWKATAVVSSFALLAGIVSGYFGYLIGHLH